MRVPWRPLVVLIACLGATALLTACDKLASLSSRQEPAKEDPFDISQDSRGRTIKTNKVTGETAILEGNRFVPVKVAKPKSAGSSSPRRDTAQVRPTSPAADPAVAPAAAPVAAAAPSESTSPPAPVLAVPDATVTLTTAAPLFVLPDARREPLRVGPVGMALTVLSVEGDWYLVEFSDPRWGPRLGYVQTKYTRTVPRLDSGVKPRGDSSAKTDSAAVSAPSQPPVAPAGRTAPPSSAPAVSTARESSITGKQRIDVRIIDRLDSATNYTYVVPGYTGSGAPAQRVSYQVSGATVSLQLADGRVAVVNCPSKLNWTDGKNPTAYRSCRTPLVNDIQAEFDGENAKLWWSVSIDGRKMESETYKILAVLDKR